MMNPTTRTKYLDGQHYDEDNRPWAYVADPVRGFATLAASGAVIAPVAGFKIRVLGFIASALAATAIKFQNTTGGQDLSATFSLGNTGGLVVPVTPAGWFDTAVGDGLSLNMTVATTVGVQVIYALVSASA